MKALKQYLPVLLTVLVAVLQAVYGALSDNVLSTVELLNVVIAVTAAITVYVVPVLPDVTWLKPAVSAVAAAVMVLIDALTKTGGAGVNGQTWVMALIQLVLGTGLVLATQKNVPVTVPVTTEVKPGGVVPENGAYNVSGLLWTVLVVLLIIAVVIWILNAT